LPTILIAEDNDLNRELLRELLQAHGYDVREAVNGRQAIDLMRKARPDVALLDLDMPVLDGFATLKQIRQDPSLFSLPVMAVTASAMRGDREKALEAGFDVCFNTLVLVHSSTPEQHNRCQPLRVWK
jgi:CheY-like chemotaxis protein